MNAKYSSQEEGLTSSLSGGLVQENLKSKRCILLYHWAATYEYILLLVLFVLFKKYFIVLNFWS
jgi:hypothetical protein